MKRMTYATAPAHIRSAIREAATRWETTDGTPLTEILDHPRPLNFNMRTRKVYCAGCLASAASVEELDAKPCLADYHD